MSPVAAFRKGFNCPVCDGNSDMPSGQGRRCAGFLSGDRKYARCTNDRYRGTLDLDQKTQPPTYAHRLDGPCKCGVDHLGGGVVIDPPPSSRSSIDDWHPVMPVPDYAEPPSFWRKDSRKPMAEPWAYRDSQGRLLYYRVRLPKGTDGDKEVKPYSYCEGPGGKHRWTWKGPASGRRQIYNQQGLAARPDAPVLVVEGEKTADAAGVLLPEWVVVTWDGGADGVHHADWRPLAGRRIVLWPDADRPDATFPDGKGAHAMRKAAELAIAAGAVEANLVELPAALADACPGWDLADLSDPEKTPAGFGLDQVLDLIGAATTLRSSTPIDDQVADSDQASGTIAATSGAIVAPLVARFLEEFTREAEAREWRSQELWDEYQAWCAEDENRATNRATTPDMFGRILTELGWGKRKATGGVRVRVHPEYDPATSGAIGGENSGAISKRPTRERNTPENVAADILAPELRVRFRYLHSVDRWYAYDSGRGTWGPEQKSVVLAAVDQAIAARGLAPNGYGERYVASILGLLRARIGVFDFSRRIGFANGVLVDGKLVPHAPDHLILNALPFNYDPAATCEPVVEWLRWAAREEYEPEDAHGVVHILRCYLHAVVNGRSDAQVFLELLGPGGTGKGTFVRLARALVGEHATIATELKHLETNRFETATLKDKLLVQINDSDRYGGDVQILKQYTGGDALRYEEKGKQHGKSFTASGMVIITCNEPIRSSDYTSGLARRRITVKFDRQVDMAEARDLMAEFAPYLPGVYNWVNQLDPKQVIADLRSATTTVEALAEVRDEIEQSVNPLAAWVLETLYYLVEARTKVGAAAKIPAKAGGSRRGEWGEEEAQRAYYLDHDKHLYPSYRQWCEEAGAQAMSLQRFTDNLVDLLVNQYKLEWVSKKRLGNGIHIMGVTLSGDPTDWGTPKRIGEARSERREQMKTMKTSPEVFMPGVSRHKPLNEDHEDHEDLEKSSIMRAHTHAHRATCAQAHSGGSGISSSRSSQSSQNRAVSGLEASEGQNPRSSSLHEPAPRGAFES